VEVDGDPPLIIDLGTGLRPLGEYLRPTEPSAAPQPVGGPLKANALLTHLHYDHVLGLPFFTPMRNPGAELDVYGPTQETGPLMDVLAGIVQPPFFPIHMAEFRGDLRFHELEGTEEFSVASCLVTARDIPHIGHTLGFRVEAGGIVLAYLSDHQAPADGRSIPEGVLELCDGADLVLHDAQYTDQEFAALPDFGHSTAAYAAHVASEAGARRLALFHHDPAHTDDEIDRILAGVSGRLPSQCRLEITAASEGAAVDLAPVAP
jgi:ribonuclease BN (tRNA processing enzyme)